MAGFSNTSAALSATYSVTENPAVGFSNGTIAESDTSQILLTAGSSGAGKIDLHYESGTVTTPLSISTGTTLTLSALTDGLGRTVAFAHVTGFWIRLTETSPSGYITLAQGATNPFILLEGSGGVIRINRFFMWSDDTGGLAVASGSADKILLTASSGTIKILLGITGISA